MNRCQTFDPRRDARTFQLNMPEQLEPLVLPAILDHLRQAAPHIEIRCNSLHWADLKAELAPDASTSPSRSPGPPTPPCAASTCSTTACA